MISEAKQLLLHKKFITSHLGILFPLTQVTALNYPYSAFLQRQKQNFLPPAARTSYLYNASKLGTNYPSKQMYDLPEILNDLNF